MPPHHWADGSPLAVRVAAMAVEGFRQWREARVFQRNYCTGGGVAVQAGRMLRKSATRRNAPGIPSLAQPGPRGCKCRTAAINHELLARMKLDGGIVITQVGSTPLPHTRFELGRAKEPLAWRASRLYPITCVVLVVEPFSNPVGSRRVVEALNTLGHHAEALKLMRESESAKEMLAILSGVSFHRT